tara:strand:+ start:163 stop:549 length:387 start_codon:yes stop_codon:yes gene_type:complete
MVGNNVVGRVDYVGLVTIDWVLFFKKRLAKSLVALAAPGAANGGHSSASGELIGEEKIYYYPRNEDSCDYDGEYRVCLIKICSYSFVGPRDGPTLPLFTYEGSLEVGCDEECPSVEEGFPEFFDLWGK